MKFNDSIQDESLEKKGDENYFDGIDHSAFTKRQFGFKLSNVMGTPVLLSLTGVIVLVVLVGLIVIKTGKSFDAENVSTMDARLKQMEDRFIDLGLLEKKLNSLEGQGDKLDRLASRINTLESNLSARMEKISRQLKTSKNQVAKSRQKINRAAPPKKALKKKGKPSVEIALTYHHVRSGDTLYRISRRYNLSLKELKQLNPSLAGKKNIFPGQKLRIKKRQ